MAKIAVQNTNITILNIDGEDYVSITDIARHKSDDRLRLLVTGCEIVIP